MNMWGVTFGGYLAKMLSFNSDNLLITQVSCRKELCPLVVKSNPKLYDSVAIPCLHWFIRLLHWTTHFRHPCHGGSISKVVMILQYNLNP